MKVLQVGKYYPPRWGGMETVVKDLCETLSTQVEVEAIVANDGRGRVEERAPGFRLTRLANMGSMFSQPLTPGLWLELGRRRADIVHVHEPNPLALTAWLASKRSGKLVIHYHSDVVRQKRLGRMYGPILHRALARAKAVIVGSAELRDSSPALAQWKHKCEVVPFGIDLKPFLALDPAMRSNRAGPPVILAVGRLSYYKGFRYAIEAMTQAPGRLVIAGEGAARTDLEDRIDRANLRGRVSLAGRVSFNRLLGLLQEADIFCLPSCEPSEAFGLAMVEAMASGLPVVSTDLPTGVRTVNHDGVTGIVVRPGDSQSLAAALRLLAEDAPLRMRFGLAGRARAEQLFNRERMAHSILKLYEAVVGDETESGEENSR